uniref:Cytochrome b6-f complex subunit 6 n=1 Tax=Wiesnerella denudata TaxID=179049 RepID=A0A7G5XV56_9MARC|nr:cytochrome b6/f complex subunit VI [Wiesnerella denudata]QNA49890.1 cytochrome b6/f complex subunit VI [Wiesnerella denudata]
MLTIISYFLFLFGALTVALVLFIGLNKIQLI